MPFNVGPISPPIKRFEKKSKILKTVKNICFRTWFWQLFFLDLVLSIDHMCLLKYFLAAAQRQFRLKQSEFNFLLWIASESFSSIYCLWWDLTQDWGLFEKRSTGCRRILRSRIVFPRKFYFFGKLDGLNNR